MNKDQDKSYPLSEADREALSAMVDGEAESLEIRRMLKLSGSGNQQQADAVGQTWARYNCIQEAARGEASGFQHLDISRAVSQAISGETPESLSFSETATPQSSTEQNNSFEQNNTSGHKSSGWGKSLRGVAIAASVAVVTVIGVNVLQQGGTHHLPVEGSGNMQVAAMTSTVSGDQGVAENQGAMPSQAAQPRATFTTGANSQLASFGTGSMSKSMPSNDQRFVQGSMAEENMAKGMPQEGMTSAYDLSQAKARRAQELRKMEGYLLKHSQNSAISNSTHGMIPMARAVNYEAP